MNYEALSKEQLIDLIHLQNEELDIMDCNLQYAENENKVLFEQIEELTNKFAELQCKISGRRY